MIDAEKINSSIELLQRLGSRSPWTLRCTSQMAAELGKRGVILPNCVSVEIDDSAVSYNGICLDEREWLP